MTKKMTYGEIRLVQDTIPKAGMQAHYVLGCYEAMLADMIESLPRHKQQEAVDTLARIAVRASQVDA